MRFLRYTAALALTFGLASPARAAAPSRAPSPITRANRQLVLVRSESWAISWGTLQRYERTESGDWIAKDQEISVDLGRHGMAWGRGLHATPSSGAVKAEGDGKSPAGVFALGRAFGIAPTLPSESRGFPYLQTQPTSYCVEDLRSNFYNQIIDARDVSRNSWEKWSELRRRDGLFDWAVVVRQNDPSPQKGAGSCVFLHVWRGPRIPTAGCTAMARDNVQAMLRWLDPARQPVLVQLPRPALEAVRDDWGLP